MAREVIQVLIAIFRPSKKIHYSVPSDNISYPQLRPKKIGLKKRIQRNRIVKAFIVLIKWSKRHQISFYPTLGPKEYISLIINKLPETKTKLEFIADTFEEAVFSDHIIGSVAIKTYVHHIKEIISR